MPKFFVGEDCFSGNHIELTCETAHHIINVLRHRIGDEIILCDGKCTDYVTKLVMYESRNKNAKARFEVIETKKCLTEPGIFVRLYQSVIKWENFDFAIQKSVEVGASEIVPVVTSRSIYRMSDVKKKMPRFNRIAKSAAEQSMRGIVPKVVEPKALCDTQKDKDAAAFFACCDEKVSLAGRLHNLKFEKADLWVGPEGGFTDLEKESLLAKMIIPFGLGPRVFRSETASIVSIACIQMLL